MAKRSKPLDVFGDAIAEVLAVSKTRAFILDVHGAVRFCADGEERPSPVTVEMPGMALVVADPMKHRTMSAAEAAHTTAKMKLFAPLAKRDGVVVERAMFWKGAGYHDFARQGCSVVWRYGMNNAFNEKVRICRGQSERDATDFLSDIRAKPPAGFKPTSPYYIAKRGCIVRTYAKGDKRELRGVVDCEWRRFGGEVLKTFATAHAAQQAYERWVHEHVVDGWGEFGIEIDKRSKDAIDARLAADKAVAKRR